MQMAMMLGRSGGGGAFGVSSFPSSSSCSSSSSSSSCFMQNAKPTSLSTLPLKVCKFVTHHRYIIACSTLQESSTSTETKEVKTAQKQAPAKAKPPAKAPVKPLPQMMEEDVIPSLKAIFEAQDDISELELSFHDNRLEGSFLKEGNPYFFWAFFPNGVLTGPKGFSLSSYGSEASTVEPFLIDEKKITANHVVFWVEKRLAAQGIIPVWKD
ncbi:uncharacterized protein LOC121240029 isoform X2 [Juglans microcarpa x Juglans regia]|uniref:uncharacterized protein LOC121240029 isoform X2 n=1 Tax=Juglans microcarpa x Juglans regia TaxID=2249226 RepID=UPI001B7F68BA|nr:uncharacterized protein LOC121240029 isoform X2 [Juglans microcarpa x Juglans regia]